MGLRAECVAAAGWVRGRCRTGLWGCMHGARSRRVGAWGCGLGAWRLQGGCVGAAGWVGGAAERVRGAANQGALRLQAGCVVAVSCVRAGFKLDEAPCLGVWD